MSGSDAGLGPRVHCSLSTAVVAKPVAIRDFLQTDAVGVPHFLTAIAVHEDIFIIIFATSLAWLFILIFIGGLEEHGGVEVRNLGSFLDDIGGNDGA
jgi:hypothetical protein